MKKIAIIIALMLLVGILTAAVFIALEGPQVQEVTIENQDEQEEMIPVERDSRLTKFVVENAEEREAVCNDGTSAVYYHRPAEVGFEDKWVVWFEGGGGCLSPEDCAQRWETERYLMTSSTSGEFAQKGGVLSVDAEENPDFYQWNHVMLNYCSSDSWHGDAVHEAAGRTWYFKGKDIVEAVFEDLMDPEIFGDDNLAAASQVLVTGTSAGGGGVSQNINDIAGWLDGIDVRAVIDSSWSIDRPDLSLAEFDRSEVSDEAYVFRGSRVDNACLADYPDDPGQCQILEVLYPYFAVPTFIYIDQLDRLKLNRIGVTDPQDPAQRDLIQSYAEAIRDSLVGLSAVFSPQATFHGTITNSRFYDVEINGYSFQEVLGNWYFDREGPTTLIEE